MIGAIGHFLLALFFISIGGGATGFLFSEAYTSLAWERSPAPVQQLEMRELHTDGNEGSIAVHYSFDLEGHSFEGHRIGPIFATAFSFTPADPQYAYFDPAAPEASVLTVGFSGMTILLIVVGIVIALLSIIFFRLAAKSLRKPAASSA